MKPKRIIIFPSRIWEFSDVFPVVFVHFVQMILVYRTNILVVCLDIILLKEMLHFFSVVWLVVCGMST